MYIKSNANNDLVDSNYSPKRLRQDYPNTSFPSTMSNASLAAYYIFPVTETTGAGDVITDADPALINGVWTQQWASRDFTSEETAAQLVELQASIMRSTQSHLDATAKAHGYDSILSACTYANSSVTRYGAEGTYCVGLRDATWSALETILGEVQAGSRAVPTGFADISASLPAVVWPS